MRLLYAVVLFALLHVASSAFAADPVAIAWTTSGSSSIVPPTQHCSQFSLTTSAIFYGHPTQVICSNGAHSLKTATCPNGYVADFQKQLCMPNATPTDQLLAMPMEDAKQLTWLIIGCWTTALVFGLLVRSLNHTTTEREY